ncbi:T9SS type A sorting domain-containing protein [Hymenobacter nivis]|uniref:T9SS C-terminal target domain-containing protein n=1 Tax=Hymenobacter nivis TaxID=1850093 RepID=A0A2Z3GLV8_9BACT|nr:T9SS type A sorting domain-containing protein [Hymenobacter nivis]AWM31895.1 hypothetical protein DDQ68_03280 [Hymenobacter nivis]
MGKSVSAEAGYAILTNLVCGDGGANGWFPDYTLATFQGKTYPQPTSATARRIVVAYASNPLTNGNGAAQTGAVGNHTPQDIWVAAEDNTNTHAQQITGRGLLDNTAILAEFIQLTAFATVLSTRGSGVGPLATASVQLSPVPFAERFQVAFTLATAGAVTVELFNEAGQKVQTVVSGQAFGPGAHAVAVDGARLRTGLYVAAVTVDGQVVSQKTIKL